MLNVFILLAVGGIGVAVFALVTPPLLEWNRQRRRLNHRLDELRRLRF